MPEKRLILANGESYVKNVRRTLGGASKELPRSYDEARAVVISEINTSLDRIASLPSHKVIGKDIVLCMRLHPDLTAKSYDPRVFFIQNRELENVGSRNYNVATKTVAPTKSIQKKLQNDILTTNGRMLFVRSNEEGFKHFLKRLDSPESAIQKQFKQDIQKIEKFNLLTPDEQILGFSSEWKEGRVELVLHPSYYGADEQLNFLRDLFGYYEIGWSKTKIAPYGDGPLFISCRIDKEGLNLIAGANPLRTVHPMSLAPLEDLRGGGTFPAPKAPVTNSKSTIKVGMFDGGVVADHELLKNFVEVDDSSTPSSPPSEIGIAHGTAVAGAILYGSLNQHIPDSPLPTPSVAVVSFRVLPTSDPQDVDLYECIDAIEAIVPTRKDISVFNMRGGPRVQILDDTISRFTYALDTLAVEQKVTFYVAVGNDGKANGLNRIQAPSDLVNGIGVGAHTERDGKLVHAAYSCRGPGRECGKVKPDVAAFGGCEIVPLHLVARNPGEKTLNYGTSFATPQVASIGAQLTNSFDRGTSLLSRTLIIHTANHPDGKPDDLLGHGVAASSIDQILRCDEKTVTIVFQGAIHATQSKKLPILLPTKIIEKGKINLNWTIAALPTVDRSHPADYTQCCIEDTFFPHDEMFRVSKTDKITNKTEELFLHLTKDKDEIANLIKLGWKVSEFPRSKSGNKYRSEEARRAIDCKWEPIVQRQITMQASSLEDPFIVLHAIPRNTNVDQLNYAAVVTISIPKFTGDIYDAVLRRYPALQPIRLRSQAELRVRF